MPSSATNTVRAARDLGRNDPCWCGSGKKYKKCHLNRKSETRLPFRATSNAMRSAWQHRQCLHPLAAPGVCDKIISAHTLQRSRALEQITDSSNHVRTFYPVTPDADGRLRVHHVGWREASTFTGFCARHDNLTFGPLETVTFSGDAEQCFLIGYRALCHEIHQKTCSLKAQPAVRAMVDRGLPVEFQREIQDNWSVLGAGTRAGLADFEALKAHMDGQLLAKAYPGWSRMIVHFLGDLCLLSTGAVSPNRDLSGKQLQVWHDTSVKQETLLCGVVSTPQGGAVVLTWLARQRAQRLFVESMLKEGGASSTEPSGPVCFCLYRKSYFSGRWWESLSEDERNHLTALAEISNAYYTDFHYSSSSFVPWQVTDVLFENAAV
jgi:hypothetical protein